MSMSTSFLRIMMVILVAASVAGCHASTEPGGSQWPEVAKIKFRFDNIRPDGLRGSPNGLVAVSYEFCVPANEQAYEDVQQIDPSLQIHLISPGRIGCSTNQTLCIGETHQLRWRDVLRGLSSLTYITEIRESFFE